MKHQGYLNDNLSSVLVKFHHFYKLLKLCTVIDGTFIIHAILWWMGEMVGFIHAGIWHSSAMECVFGYDKPKNVPIWIQLNILNIYSFGRDWLVLDQVWVFWTLIYYVSVVSVQVVICERILI